MPWFNLNEMHARILLDALELYQGDNEGYTHGWTFTERSDVETLATMCTIWGEVEELKAALKARFQK